jgi:hypothetical protein
VGGWRGVGGVGGVGEGEGVCPLHGVGGEDRGVGFADLTEEGGGVDVLRELERGGAGEGGVGCYGGGEFFGWRRDGLAMGSWCGKGVLLAYHRGC